MRALLLSVLLSLAPLAMAAPPTLTPQAVGGVAMAVPGGWSVSQPGPSMWVGQEPVSGPAAGTLVLMMVPAQQGQLAVQQLLGSALQQPRLVRSQPTPQGALLQIFEGQSPAGPGRVALLTGTDPATGVGTIAAFGAPISRFDKLGGTELLLAFAARTHPVAATSSQVSPQRASSARRLSLFQLAEGLERLPPAQVAASLRGLPQNDMQLLMVYPAFANLVHAIGCQADPGLALPTTMGPQSCTRTAQGWQQTLQFTGSWEAALSQALDERGRYLISVRCGDGSLDANTCTAYRQQVQSLNAMSHETSMRIISNMSPDGCLLGDPGCVQ